MNDAFEVLAKGAVHVGSTSREASGESFVRANPPGGQVVRPGCRAPTEGAHPRGDRTGTTTKNQWPDAAPESHDIDVTLSKRLNVDSRP